MAYRYVQYHLRHIHQQPCYPAVPLLQGRKELCHKYEHSHAGVQIRNRVGRENPDAPPVPELAEEPPPKPGYQKHRNDGSPALRPCKHGHLQCAVVLRTLLRLLRMGPAVMPENVDSEGYRLQEQAGIQILVPEHQKQECRIEITHPEIVFAVASGKEHTGQPQDRSDQVYQQHRHIPAYGKQRIVQKFFHL